MQSNKKQIVFIEGNFTIPAYKIARALKLKNYETILITYSDIDEPTKTFLEKAYDKVLIFPIGDIRVISFKNIMKILKLLRNTKFKEFLRRIKDLKPYIIQITGPDILTALSVMFYKKAPVVYFAHDIWRPYQIGMFAKKNSGRMILINKFIEDYCFRKAEGVLYKGPEDVLKYLKIKTKGNNLKYLSGCLEEWLIEPYSSKKLSDIDGETHLVYAGGPWLEWEEHMSFFDLIKIITSQKIHFHLFCPYPLRILHFFKNLEKSNTYFHLHRPLRGLQLSRQLSKFDYGIAPDFLDPSSISKKFSSISLATKLFTYVEAGIPVIVSKDLTFTSKIVDKNRIGLSISKRELHNLKGILSRIPKKYFYTYLKNFQRNESMRKIIKEIISFYNKICFKPN